MYFHENIFWGYAQGVVKHPQSAAEEIHFWNPSNYFQKKNEIKTGLDGQFYLN